MKVLWIFCGDRQFYLCNYVIALITERNSAVMTFDYDLSELKAET